MKMRNYTALLATLLLTATSLAEAAPGPAAKPASKAAAKPAPKAAAKPVAAAPKIVPLPETEQAAQLRRAFHFAFPIYEVMRTRTAQLARARAFGLPNAVNFLLPKLSLAGPADRDVTTPNNDTLYGSVWLDLSAGPVIVDMPALAGRYNSAALMSLQTDNTSIVGTRTGSFGGRYAYVPPGYTGVVPAGAEVVRSATTDAWLLIRVLVNGPEDVEAASKAIDGYKLTAPGGERTALLDAPPRPDAKTFLAVVNEALARSAANTDLAGKAAAFAALGIGAPASDETLALWKQYLPALNAELKGGLAAAGDIVDGWSYPGIGIGDYGDDEVLRARVALGGLAALPRIEAMYLTARTDKAGAALDGSKAYTVTLPPRLPVGAFWSLTMYQQEADGRLFFVPNPLDRYAVGDRSPQLRSNRDGSYDIFVQASKPSGERVVNWLPAPKGKFVLVFRGYLPRAPFLDGSFRLPPVVASETIP
jgi:hypothetical protein